MDIVSGVAGIAGVAQVALKGRTDLASRETQHEAKTQLAASVCN